MIALTFDLGQTGFRARTHVDGVAGPAFSGSGYVMGAPIGEAVETVAREAAAVSGATRFDTVVGGLTGVFGRVPDPHDTAEALHAAHGTTRLVLADDAVTSYLGAVGTAPGAVVAVGTGLVALARSEDGVLARADGLGALVGDEGAGWWIGRQGLIAALSAADGREPSSPALLEVATERYGSLAAIPVAIASSPAPIGEVAGFARAVVDASRAGDPAARGILEGASRHIAGALLAVARRAGLGDTLAYTLIGGLASAGDQLRPGIERRIADEWGPCRHREPAGTSLDGADLLLTEASVLPRGPLLREAGRDAR